jgi:hypothetical protein
MVVVVSNVNDTPARLDNDYGYALAICELASHLSAAGVRGVIHLACDGPTRCIGLHAYPLPRTCALLYRIPSELDP